MNEAEASEKGDCMRGADELRSRPRELGETSAGNILHDVQLPKDELVAPSPSTSTVALVTGSGHASDADLTSLTAAPTPRTTDSAGAAPPAVATAAGAEVLGAAAPCRGAARPTSVRALFDDVCRRFGVRSGFSRLGLGSVASAAADLGRGWLLPTSRCGSTSTRMEDDPELAQGGAGARSAISLVHPAGRGLSVTRDLLPSGAVDAHSLSADRQFLRASTGRVAGGGGGCGGGVVDAASPPTSAGKSRYGGATLAPSLRMVLGVAQASEAMAAAAAAAAAPASSPEAMSGVVGLCPVSVRRRSAGYAPGPDSADSCSSIGSIPVVREGSYDTWTQSSSCALLDTPTAPRAGASAGPRDAPSHALPLGSAPSTPPRLPTSSSLPPPPTMLSGGSVCGMPPAPMSQPLPGLFKPRAVPGDGLLYLSPAARASMWSAARGARWSLSQYEVGHKMYTGYASSVHKAVCRTSGTEVVLKLYQLSSLSDFLRHQVLRELEIHSRLRCPSMVQLLAAFKEGDTLALVMEYVRGGSLQGVRRKLRGRMNEQWAVQLVVLPLLRAVAYLHRLGIVHRDIKPENLLFTPDWRLKLCDFGVSIALHEERAVTRAGSREYMAPEVSACPLKNLPHDNKAEESYAYGYAADIFSVGAVVYELMTGFPPFPCGSPPLQRKPAPVEEPQRGQPCATAAQEGAEAGGAAPRRSADYDAEAVVIMAPHSRRPEQQQEQEQQQHQQGSNLGKSGAVASCPLHQQSEVASEASRAPTTPLRNNGAPSKARPAAPAAAADAAARAPPPSRGDASASSPQLAFPSSVSPAARSFIRACLEPHPGDRATVEQLIVHDWVMAAQQACRSGPVSHTVPEAVGGEPTQPAPQDSRH
ncbi:hypothetical protein HYH02_003904 [Chlamydomonas schloesseri]|uniref:Protein kinase domain-containing protein n=1 Tax=Chlamydomonas schloesseri TaxID=2026947 RepID=A0A836B980_9CHLO|nr:hypothetical protein HYH02_003904 [Chlamydomonas schloesseri]|eukprot:KAG2451298.1 hypothetical protein HYH02_003904 [Chlamydomonas schloesseri]